MTTSIDPRPLLGCKDASFSVGGAPVLTGMNVTVQPGECLVVLGPNGVGKTTLMRGLAGIIRPDSGEVMLEGRALGKIPIRDRARKIAWVPQDEQIDFGWTATQFVALGRIAQSPSFFETHADHAAIARALELVDMAGFADRSVLAMSGGERQRVRIARGLAQEAPLLMLDEPTAHLDLAHQSQVLSVIKRLQGQGVAVIVTLHDLNQAIALGARYLLLQGPSGTVFETNQELVKSPQLEEAYRVRLAVSSLESGEPVVVPIYR